MKFCKILVIVLVTAAFIVSCKPAAKKEMTPEDFLKIEDKIISETNLTPEAKEAVAKEFGYTLKQFRDFEEKVENDPELRTRIGGIRLKQQQE